jgi:hypothetical protein
MKSQPVGAVLVVSGAVLLLSSGAFGQQSVRQHLGEGADDWFGASLARAGDVNADGVEDYVVGAPELTSGVGYVKVFSGADGSTLYTFRGTVSGETYGMSVDAAGDVNADGYADVLIGAPELNASMAGKAQVRSGLDGSLLYNFVGSGNDSLGRAVAAAGDLNQDGYDDVLVGAPGVDFVSMLPGFAVLYSGRDGSALRTFRDPTATRGNFGSAVAGGADINADGMPDLLIGNPTRVDSQQRTTGSVRIFSGSNFAQLRQQVGPVQIGALGSSIDAAGDVNGDGYDDYVVGDAGHIPNSSGFAAYLYSGRDQSLLYTYGGDCFSGGVGLAVAGGEDVNGDGIEDALIGAPGGLYQFGLPGLACLYSGLTGQVLYSFNPRTTRKGFGTSVDFISDLDGDGLPDVLVGDQLDDRLGFGGFGNGAVTVYSGNTLFLRANTLRPPAGLPLELFTREGRPGDLTATFVVELGGLPCSCLIFGLGVFDAQRTRKLSGVVPAGLSGLSIKLRSYQIDSASGELHASFDEELSFP